MIDDDEELQPDTTRLALDRTFLAYERTLMAWIRTSVSLLTFGFTIFKFFQYVMEREPEKHAQNLLGPKTIGLLMIVIGTLMLGLASFLHWKKMKELSKMYHLRLFSQALLFATLISIIGVLMIINVIIRH